MKLANLDGRAALVLGEGAADLERASGGRFPADPMQALRSLEALRDWAAGLGPGAAEAPLDETRLGPPVPRPAKVFGIGLNYRAHAVEAGLEIPKVPMVFTKFPTCLAGPRADVVLSDSGACDYEAELVVVIGRGGRRIPEARAFEHVGGYCAGQDISDRRLQFADRPPQFSLGKSYDTFGPLGPVLVTLDAIADPGDLRLTCEVSGERLQDGRTSDMLFPVVAIVAYLSSVCTLEAGDLIFTGTPAGVGSMRNSRRYLVPGDEIVTTLEGVGRLVNRCRAA